MIASVVRVPWHAAHSGYRLLDHLPEVRRTTPPTRRLAQQTDRRCYLRSVKCCRRAQDRDGVIVQGDSAASSGGLRVSRAAAGLRLHSQCCRCGHPTAASGRRSAVLPGE